MSGYTLCPCCGDDTVSDDENHPELCDLCEEAGCDPDCGPEDCACQRPDAYEDQL